MYQYIHIYIYIYIYIHVYIYMCFLLYISFLYNNITSAEFTHLGSAHICRRHHMFRQNMYSHSSSMCTCMQTRICCIPFYSRSAELTLLKRCQTTCSEVCRIRCSDQRAQLCLSALSHAALVLRGWRNTVGNLIELFLLNKASSLM